MKPNLLFENFEMLADAPNGIVKLRELILQLAVQGKLVPQDPNDEPASVLIEKIKAEKEHLIKEKKIKKMNSLPSIELDEDTFHLPNSWAWTRLGEISHQITDGTHFTPNYIQSGIPFLSVKNISQGILDFSDTRFIAEKDHQELTKRCKPEFNDILICRIGTLGKPVLVDVRKPFSIFVSVGLIKFATDSIYPPFLLKTLKSPLLTQQYEEIKAGGSHTNKLNLRDLPSLKIPIPPQAEQSRIAAKVDQLMAHCDELETRKQKKDESRFVLNYASLDSLLSAQNQIEFDKNWNHISNNFNLLYDNPENVGKLRDAILQLAVQGKLVPQDPNDKPASILLEKIAKEKELLIKEGKIKKQKLLPTISEDEKPYELPNGWEWVRLGNYGTVFSGKTFKSGDFNNKDGVKVIKITNAGVGEFIETADYLPITFLKKNEFYIVKKNDLIVALTRPYISTGLKICKCPESYHNSLLNQRVAAIRFHTDERYAFIFLRSLYVLNLYKERFSSTGLQPNLKISDVTELVLPIPPLSEQKRIAAKVDQFMVLCDELKSKLSQSQSDCDELLTATISNNSAREVKVANKKMAGPTQRKKSDRRGKAKSTKTNDSEDPEHVAEIKSGSTNVTTPKDNHKTKTSEKTKNWFDKLDVLRAFRKAIFHQNDLDEYTLLRLVGQHLGVQRLSKPIRQELESYIRTAIRRKIIARNGDGFNPATPTINHYDEDYLIHALNSIIRKGYEYQRNHVVENLAVYLGYDKVSYAFAQRMKTIFRLAIRRGELYRNGAYVGKF